MYEYLQYILDSFIYSIVDAIAFGLSVVVLIRLITWATPLGGFEKIKENYVAMTIIWAIILVLFGAFTISGYFIPA